QGRPWVFRMLPHSATQWGDCPVGVSAEPRHVRGEEEVTRLVPHRVRACTLHRLERRMEVASYGKLTPAMSDRVDPLLRCVVRADVVAPTLGSMYHVFRQQGWKHTVLPCGQLDSAVGPRHAHASARHLDSNAAVDTGDP